MGSIPAPADDSERAVTRIYNSAIAAPAIGTAWEVGLLVALKDQGSVHAPKFAEENNLDGPSIIGLAVAMAVVGVVNVDQEAGIIKPGRHFDETFRNKSMFHWLTLGSGGLFSKMQHLVRKDYRVGDYHQRDPAAIAYSCREINRQFYDPIFWRVVEGLDYKFHKAVDLGCGSGERLMQILSRYNDTTAMGIDVAQPALEFAEVESQKRGFASRLSFAQGDARNMEYREEFADVDLLTCFMMGHDFWPRENCIASLRKLRTVFPKVRRLLLGDETRGLLYSNGSKPPGVDVTEENVPIFCLGLEMAHALMDVYIPTVDEWYGIFEECGWRCVKGHEFNPPAFSVIFELEPLD